MSWYQREQEERVVVAEVTNAAEADFLRISLAVQGIDAAVSAASVVPSVDFVQGLRITVRRSDEDAARAILGGLGPLSQRDAPDPP